MWVRVLLAAAVVACTVTHALGPQQLDHIKDVLCVVLLNSIKNEELDSINRGLQNVNISGNNEELNDIQRILDLTSNKTRVTKQENEGNIPNNVGNKNIQTPSNRLQERNKNNEKTDKSRTEKYLQDQKINCSSVMDYSSGQPTLFSMMHFFRDCLNISTTTEQNNEIFNYENTSVNTQTRTDFNNTRKVFAPPQEIVDEINRNHTDTLPEVTETSDETRPKNSLNYFEYKENNYLNGNEDLTKIKEFPRYDKSGYGNIFYTFNESYGNALDFVTVLGPVQDILKSLIKTPRRSTSDDNLGGKQFNLDTVAKIHDTLNFLQNTPIERVISLDRPSTEAIERRLIHNQLPKTPVLKEKNSVQNIRRDFTTLPTTNAEFSVSTLHFVNYIPSSINISNEAKFKAKITPKSFYRVFDMNYNYGNPYFKTATEEGNTNDMPKGYFYPRAVIPKGVNKNQEDKIYKDEVGSQFFRNTPKAKYNKIEAVVSASTISYMNYLYPAKNIESLSDPTDSIASFSFKLSPHFRKEYVISREAAEHDYYQYEKVKSVASKHNIHPSVYFYPEILNNKPHTMKPRLPSMFFIPNEQKRGNDKFIDYAFKTQQDSFMRNIPITADASFLRDSSKLGIYKSMPLTRQLEQIKTLDIAGTQNYADVTDRTMNSNVIRNESVSANKNIFPNNVITDIAESIKEDILQNLRKELNIPSSTKSTTALTSFPALVTSSTTKVSEINMQTVHTSRKIVTQDIVLEKIMKFLEQINASKNGLAKINDLEMKNMKMLNEDVEILTTETYVRKKTRQKYKSTNGDYNTALQNDRKKITVQKEILKQTEYKLKDKIIIEPKTFQTNALEISPLGVYVGSLISPINQNIIIPPSRKETDKVDRSYNMNKQERKEVTIQQSPFVLNHYYPAQNPLNDIRVKEHNYINTHTKNINFENRHKFEENTDVKYLDDKFLNTISRDSNALHPSIRDCCNQKHVSQLMYECCNDKVASRRQKPLIMNNPTDELSYSNFLQSQHKVNAMLAKVLASKNKFRSVETI